MIFRLVYARGAIRNKMGPTQCRTTPVFISQPTEEEIYLVNLKR